MWQEIVVFSAVGLAALYMIRKYLPSRKPGTGTACGQCKGCSGGGCH